MASRPKVLILAGTALFSSFFDERLVLRLSRRFAWERRPDRSISAALSRRLREADALVTTWDSPVFDESLLEAAPRLRVVAHCGGEVKARFAPELFRRLVIANAPGPMAGPVAELALAFLLQDARRLDHYASATRGSGAAALHRRLHLHGTSGETLRGAAIGLVGLGRVGRDLAELLSPLGAHVRAFDPLVPARDVPAHVERAASLDPMLRRSRFVVLAAALTPRTRHLLDRRRLALLPDGALVVNVGRGGLVDLDALADEVASGRIRCALDVTDPLEPLPRAHRLRRLPGAVITPHVGASDVSVRRAIAGTTLDTLERIFDGRRIATRVTPAMLGRMT